MVAQGLSSLLRYIDCDDNDSNDDLDLDLDHGNSADDYNDLTIVSLSTRVFETRTATGRQHFARQDNGASQIFMLIISNGEKILNSVILVV